MIKTIKLNYCIPYQKAEISECKKINFIFGANGSGKSTISSFLAGVPDSRFDYSTVEWTSAEHERVEVYNKSFRIANLKESIPGIFTLGSATIDDINSIEQLKTDLKQATKEWEDYYVAYQNKEQEKILRENRFKDDAWTQILKKYEKDFRGMYASQGRMLMLLMDRESDKTSYELIKKYKGKASADFWQFVAKLFKNDLKEEYDASDKDRIVERVITLVEAGQL